MVNMFFTRVNFVYCLRKTGYERVPKFLTTKVTLQLKNEFTKNLTIINLIEGKCQYFPLFLTASPSELEVKI